MTDIVTCDICKEPVSSASCWSVYNKGVKTYECKDGNYCFDANIPLPPPKDLHLFPLEVTEQLFGNNTRYYHVWASKIVYKSTTTGAPQTLIRATKEEMRHIWPAYDKWYSENSVVIYE